MSHADDGDDDDDNCAKAGGAYSGYLINLIGKDEGDPAAYLMEVNR